MLGQFSRYEVANAETGEVSSEKFLAVPETTFNRMANRLTSFEQNYAEYVERKKKEGRDNAGYVKVYRIGIAIEYSLTKTEMLAWSIIKLGLRKGSEFFYMRPSALVKLANKLFMQKIDLPQASRALKSLRESGMIVSVGVDLYMINHLLVFNGKRNDILNQHKGFYLFGQHKCGLWYKKDFSGHECSIVNDYLKSIGFNYKLELVEAAGWLERKTRLRNLVSDSSNSDIQNYIERKYKDEDSFQSFYEDDDE